MIEQEDSDKIRILHLNSPPSNVLNLALLKELREKVLEAGADTGVRCLVLASRLPKYFSSGIDLSEVLSLSAERQTEPFKALFAAYLSLLTLPKPTIACIGGNAILGGWIIAMAADFRVISEQGRIALAEIRFGASPTSLLIRRMLDITSNPNLVKAMVLRGQTLRAPEALAGGFVDIVSKPEAVLEESLSEARSLCKQSPAGYASIKRAWLGLTASDSEALCQKSLEEFNELMAHPQTQDGLLAMRDKRRPKWEN